MRNYKVAYGDSRQAKKWRNATITWDELREEKMWRNGDVSRINCHAAVTAGFSRVAVYVPGIWGRNKNDHFNPFCMRYIRIHRHEG